MNKTAHWVFFSIFIGMACMLLGTYLGAARVSPDFQVGWIGSWIYSQNEAGEVGRIWGGCLIEEDMFALEEACPECVEILPPDVVEPEPEPEDKGGKILALSASQYYNAFKDLHF